MKKIIYLIIFCCFNAYAVETTSVSIFSEMEGATDEEVCEVLNNHSRPVDIECIHLEEDTLTDKTLFAIGDFCPKLKFLTMHGNRITDKGIIALAEGCQHLRWLFVDCDDELGLLTDEGLFSLASNCQFLNRINISGHPHLTDDGAIALAKTCKNLIWFEAYGGVTSDLIWIFGQLTDSTLIALADHCPNLQRVDVSENRGVTFTGVKYLLEQCQSIKHVGVDRTSLTKNECSTLRKMYPKVEGLSKYPVD